VQVLVYFMKLFDNNNTQSLRNLVFLMFPKTYWLWFLCDVAKWGSNLLQVDETIQTKKHFVQKIEV
jgi:hypothetical protein